MKSEDDPNLNTVLDGRYELTSLIAEGGMGRVYKATQRSLDRVVAVKLLKTPRLLEDRFQFTAKSRPAPVDHLTGLATRRVLLEQLEREWERSLERGDSLSLILLSLDNFKAYNKTHGYLSGDTVLQDLASKFRKDIGGPGGCLARFSGDEFGVLLPGLDRVQAEQVAQRMAAIVAEAGVRHRVNGTDDILRASVGVMTTVPMAGSNLYELVDGADHVLRSRRPNHAGGEQAQNN